MEDEFIVALIQTDIVWENPEQNRKNLSDKINSISQKVELVILPEMFTTGFTMSPNAVAETMEGETAAWMQELADSKQTTLMGSVAIKEEPDHQEPTYFNRLLIAKPGSSLEMYDKRHTFTLAGEHEVYTAGNQIMSDEVKGWVIRPLICYDLRFPVWARNQAGYHILIYVANWPTPRIKAWEALLQARAIENMSYCIGVNRVGVDANGYEYSGHSAVYDVMGQKISNIPPNKEHIEIVTLSKEHLIKSREKFRFLDDMDAFSLP